VIKQLELKLNKLNELKFEDNYFDELEYDIYNESYNLKRLFFLNRSYGLNNLIGVWIEDNRIKQLDYDLFNGLPKLELINLQNNKLFDTDPNLFIIN
jgi:hypothetical protein